MNRIFTFGCSFTNYYLWPTWADILAIDHPVSFNWGHPGLGNQAIAERVAEAHAKFKFTPDDTIIVQWTSHLRHDWLSFRHPKSDHSHWRTKGSIFSTENQKFYNHQWMNTFWDEKAYYIRTLNHILLTQEFLNGIGCTWYMTSMSDLGKISTEVSPRTVNGELPDKDIDLFDVWDNSPELYCYKEAIWDNNTTKWARPLLDVCNETLDQHWWFDYDPKDKAEKDFNVFEGRWMEPHPSVNQHAIWLRELKATMGTPSELSDAQTAFVQQFNDIKESTKTYRQLEDRVKQTMWANTLMYRGF